MNLNNPTLLSCNADFKHRTQKPLISVLIATMLLFSNVAYGKTIITLTFSPQYHNKDIEFNDFEYPFSNNQFMKIKSLKFYISNINLIDGDNLVFAEQNSYHLIDANDASTLKIKISVDDDIRFTVIQFNLGIDSTTSVSGAYGGDLDPTKGMYWTWKSGYINFKFEGSYRTEKKDWENFQYHLGGYEHPFNAIQIINLPLIKSDNAQINLDINQLIDHIDFNETPKIMSPSVLAVAVSEQIAKCFYIKQE